MSVEVLANGHVKITINLQSIVVSREEAEAARTDPKAAAAIVRKLQK